MTRANSARAATSSARCSSRLSATRPSTTPSAKRQVGGAGVHQRGVGHAGVGAGQAGVLGVDARERRAGPGRREVAQQVARAAAHVEQAPGRGRGRRRAARRWRPRASARRSGAPGSTPRAAPRDRPTSRPPPTRRGRTGRGARRRRRDAPAGVEGAGARRLPGRGPQAGEQWRGRGGHAHPPTVADERPVGLLGALQAVAGRVEVAEQRDVASPAIAARKWAHSAAHEASSAG